MARYLTRACPRCNGYVGITIREPGRNVPLQAVNGRCTRCSYCMGVTFLLFFYSATVGMSLMYALDSALLRFGEKKVDS
jgi:hypothetical protein